MQTRRLQRTKRATNRPQIATRDGIGRSKQHGILSHMGSQATAARSGIYGIVRQCFPGPYGRYFWATQASQRFHASRSGSSLASIRDASNLNAVCCATVRRKDIWEWCVSGGKERHGASYSSQCGRAKASKSTQKTISSGADLVYDCCRPG